MIASMTRPAVLVVEDNATARAGLASVLAARGHPVSTAEHGLAAKEALIAGPRPGVILLDMLMPKMDGWYFLTWLRGTRFEDVPVVVMTGTDMAAEWAAMLHCAGFLRKPIGPNELFAAVDRAAAGVAGPPTDSAWDVVGADRVAGAAVTA